MWNFSPLPSWPARWIFPAVGAGLAACAPLGLLAVRCAQAGARRTRGGVAGGVAGGATPYLYIAAYATATFVCLGWWIGRVEDRLRATSITDPLTGLPNRRHLDARLASEITRSQRYGAPLALLMIDLDGLKGINDQGGHAAGDAAIRRVATAILGTCRRTTDLAARVGGDEFAVLAPSTTASQAQVLAERIRATLCAACSDGPAVTLSIGIADCDRMGVCEVAELQAGADRALYQAKADGRDRSVVARYRRTRRLYLAPLDGKEAAP
jgi:diguanylate cyclase (GGDEF)-like protein